MAERTKRRLIARAGSAGLAALFSALMLAGPAWAQGRSTGDQKVEQKVEAVDPSKGELQTTAPTLKNERKGPEVIRAEAFVREKKAESLKSIDTNINQIRELIRITPKDNPQRAEFLFNLAELYAEKGRYYGRKQFETEDDCFALEDAGGDERAIERCRRKMKDEGAESQRLRGEAVGVYSEIIANHGDFKGMDEVLYFYGSSLMESGQRPKALNVYRDLVREYPSSPYVANALVAFGDYYFDADEMEDAKKAYAKVMSAYSDSPVYAYAMYKTGWAEFNLDNKKKALDLFLKTLNFAKKRPDFPNSKPLKKQALRDLVTTYSYVGSPSKAIPFFRKITDDDRSQWLDMGERLAIFYADKGKFDESNALYRELMSLNKESVKVVDYQYEIVRNQIAQDTYSDQTLREILGLVKLVELADGGEQFSDRDDPKMEYPKKKAKIEEFARNQALLFHREAQQTKNASLYNKAYNIYRMYVPTFTGFTKPDDMYKMTFFYGELLYQTEDFAEAADAYEQALAIKKDGAYTEEIVHSIVLAFEKLVQVDESKRTTDVAGINEEKKGGEAEAAYTPPEPKPIPELKQKFINACERYMEYAPKGEKIVDVKYTRARLLYEHDHMKEAIPAFKDVAWNHADSEIAPVAANLHLDALYVLRDLDAMYTEALAYIGKDEDGEKVAKPPIEDEVFLEETEAIVSNIAFKRCTVLDEKKQWKKASECFVAFWRNYPASEYGDDALYNAALDYERMSDFGKAIKIRVALLKDYPESEHAPISLYNIGQNFHALAIYSQAAFFYETFVENFPDHEKASVALNDAALFRYGMGEYPKAIADFETYIDTYGKKDREIAANMNFKIAESYAKMGREKQAFEAYEEYVRRWANKGPVDQSMQARVRQAMYYWDRKGRTNRKKALSGFRRVLKEYEGLGEAEKKEAKLARDAAAQAKFMIGEDIFEEMAQMKIDSRNEKELGKRIKAKSEKGAEAAGVFAEVFEFNRPDWTIASFFRIGQGYQEYADALRGSKCPKRLTYDQCEEYKGLLEDAAGQIDEKAVENYKKALEASKTARWFNKYTKQAESRLADLRPREWRKPSEFRAEPDHMQSGFEGIDFLRKIRDEDRLEDLDRGGDDQGGAAQARRAERGEES